ncbi:MAG: ABC transporter ATP-binding protein/permease [Candidatus Cloacimonetes bacterium]|nr:ABC transporter ATP-binding protein/permease [Candidatus Cloacimonadota bacterium]
MKNLMRIYAIMLRHYGYLIAGLFFMLGYALFSGVSITMAVPFFDYVFPAVKGEIIYSTFPEFFNAIKEVTTTFVQSESIFGLLNINNFRPLLEGFGKIMEQTDSMLVLKFVAAVVLIIVFLKNVFFFFNRLMFANLNGKTIVDVRNSIFRNYLRQSLRFFTRHRVGDSLVRMVSDVEIVSHLFITSMFNAIRDLLLVLVFMRIAIYLNLRLFLLSLLILPITTFLVALVGKKIKKYARRIQAQFSDIYSKVEEVLSNMKIVKAFGREDDQYSLFQKINKQFFRFWRKAEIYSGFNVPISEMNGAITGIIILLIGGSEVLSGSSGFTFGEFTAFLFAIFSMLHPIKSISKTYTDIKKALVSLDRISEVMFNEPDLLEAKDAVSKADFTDKIEFDRVSFYYEPNKEVLKEITFTIKKGEKIAIVGSSGSGKTTLANLLLRLYDVTEGEIRIDGIPLTKIKIKDLRNLFGIVTQESLIFTDTVTANISFGTLKTVTQEDIIKAAQRGYADEFIEELPHKYEEMLYAKGGTLSGGQKQRLCIARAIVGNPPILIFDEATSSLDTEAERKVQVAIEQATKSRTVLIIAHRLSTILSSDMIIVLDAGKIVGIGDHAELLKNCPRYKVLYDLQFNV